MKELYGYDEKGFFVEKFTADLDPEETKIKGFNVYLIPTNATELEPPQAENRIPVFKNGIWELEKDYRGKTQVKLETGEPSEVTEIGELADGFVLYDDYIKTDLYKTRLLEDTRTNKTEELNIEKERAFKEGIMFNNARYDCDDRAQDRTGNRLTLLMAAPVETLEWLDYDYKAHTLTAEEFQALCAAIFTRIQFIEFKTGVLLEEIQKAESIDELNNIEIDFTEE